MFIENNLNIDKEINIKNKTTNEELNTIILQLIEFGYDYLYSKRIFHYFHPDDLEEALNYMPINNGIIKHRFVKDNRDLNNKLCYIRGEKAGIHLNFISKSLRISRSSSDSSSNNSNINKNNNSENNSNNIDSNKIIEEKYNKYNIKDANNIKNANNNIDNHMESFFNNCSIGIKDRSINNNYSDFSSNIFKNNGDINNKVKTNINNLNENIRDDTNKIKNKKNTIIKI